MSTRDSDGVVLLVRLGSTLYRKVHLLDTSLLWQWQDTCLDDVLPQLGFHVVPGGFSTQLANVATHVIDLRCFFLEAFARFMVGTRF